MMHEKLMNEFKRLYSALVFADPSTQAYSNILRNFECLDSVGPSINDFLRIAYPEQGPEQGEDPVKLVALTKAGIRAVQDSAPNGDCNEDCADCPNSEEAKAEPETEPAPAEEKPTLSAAEVRSKLAAARRAGVNVASIIKEFGADNFTALPATKYGELLDRIEHESGGMD